MTEDIPYSNKNTFAWTMYDVANTIFSMGIVSLTIIQFGEIIGMQNGLEFGQAHFFASLAVTISTLIVAFFMPFWGAYADAAGKRKPLVIVMASLTILFTGFVFLFDDFLIAISLFIIANVTYQWGNLFYDSMIPNIAPQHLTGRVSSFGVALGYGGSFVALGLNLIAVSMFGEPTDSELLETLLPGSSQLVLGHLRYMFPLCAIAFLILAIPFIFVKERTQERNLSIPKIAKESISELKGTTKSIIGYRDMLLFVIGWFIIGDAVNTVITFMKDIAVNGYQFSEGQATILLAIGVVGAFVLTYPLGPIADRWGPKTAFYIVGSLWIGATLLFIVSGIFVPKEAVYISAILIGPALGGTWVVQRQMVIELAPPDDISQYFAFSKFTGKLSAAIGPVLFSLVFNVGETILLFDRGNAYRLAISSLLVFFIVGFIFFVFITNYHDRYEKGERAPYN